MRWFLTRVLMIGFPIVEVLLIVWVGNTIGWGWTALLLVLGVVLGVALMRLAGRDAFRAVTTPLQNHQPYVEIDELTGVAQTVHPAGEPTPEEMQQAAAELRRSGLLFVSGVLFAIPGFLTDALAGILLLPPVRAAVAGRMARRAANRPTVVVVGETIQPGDEFPPSPYHRPDDPSGGPEGPVVIRGEILPPQRPIE